MRRALAVAFSCVLVAACGGPSPSTDAGSTPDLSPVADDAAASDAMGAAPKWTSFAQQFFATYCVHCHGPGNTKRDYSQDAQVQRDAMLIACGVTPGPQPLAGCPAAPAPAQFPVGNGPFPTDDERNELVAWIAAGLPQ